MESRGEASAFPEGLEDRHAEKRGGWHRHASPVSVLLLGGILVVALVGLLGGAGDTRWTVSAPGADLAVTTPATARNGIFFETLIEVTPKRDFADLVVAVDPSLWRDVTQNSMTPAASDESFEDGQFRYSYGNTEAGKTLLIKLDSQINPSLFAGDSGAVAVYDGDSKVAEVTISMKVLP